MTLRSKAVRVASGIEFEVFRGGDGPKVLYLHPASGVSADDRFANALARRFEVIAPVAPGFNDLSQLDDIADIHDFAMAYDDLLSVLRVRKIDVVGHSFGGMTAAELAAHAPHRVERLALIAPVGLWNDAHPVLDIFATAPTEIADYLWADPQGDAARAGFTGGASTPQSHEQMVDGIIRTMQGLVTAGKFMMPIPDRGLRRRLYRMSMPTLLVWGSKDRIVPPEYAEEFAAGIERAKIKIIPDAGHMVTLEQTKAVLDALRRHFKPR